jgi:anti-anti-sigma factor
MEITSQPIADGVEISPKGRLDGYWADHLSRAIEETMRGGCDRIRLNLSEVSYISSLGIRVLVTYSQKLRAIDGSFAVVDPSEGVKRILEMVGLAAELMPKVAPAARETKSAPMRMLECPSATFEVYEIAPDAKGLKCRTYGDPALLEGCRFAEAHCRTVTIPGASFALGLGAFGRSFEECRGRFGELLALSGAAAYQPTDGSNIPDFLLTEGTFVPELQVLYGAVCEGEFGLLARFETANDAPAIGLAELVDAALDIAGADTAGIVCIAESAGLVGASLRKPPVNGAADGAPFGHPEIRNWLSFTTERAHTRALAVLVGIASRSPDGELKALLRPLKGTAGTAGHFHAAAFTYRPLSRGPLDLDKTVRALFENEKLLGILHLIDDDREALGVSESEFVRGACWVAPLADAGRQGS